MLGDDVFEEAEAVAEAVMFGSKFVIEELSRCGGRSGTITPSVAATTPSAYDQSSFF
jgi:hypothetical protein